MLAAASSSKKTISLTFSECVENHTGNQVLGQQRPRGLTTFELQQTQTKLRELGVAAEYWDLKALAGLADNAEVQEAGVLVLREGIKVFMRAGADESTLGENPLATLESELSGLKWDTKCLMRGRVVNKHARQNLCFADQAQSPDYASGKGTVVPFGEIPLLQALRRGVENLLGHLPMVSAGPLLAEGNLYVDNTKNGIGPHGDSERKLVLAARIGAPMNMAWHWYRKSEPLGQEVRFRFEGGDFYIMSEKATGHDWRRPSRYTLRHAAGADKYVRFPGVAAKKRARGKQGAVVGRTGPSQLKQRLDHQAARANGLKAQRRAPRE